MQTWYGGRDEMEIETNNNDEDDDADYDEVSADPCLLGPCLTSQEAEELGYGQTLFEPLHNMNLPCIAHWCTLNVSGNFEQLPHERLWPCIGAIESEEQQLVVQNRESVLITASLTEIASKIELRQYFGRIRQYVAS
uniref:Uncharacterized protein n=1 Tax=Romanomermis culicivorax TaxID=13658 RepID=A0A915JA96_ROMCU